MNSFNISPVLNKNKVFILHKSELEKRYDPFYYVPDNLEIRKITHENKVFVSTGSIIKSWNRGDGPRDGFYTDDKTNGVYFIRINNLKENSIDLSDVKYINRNIHETTLKRAQVTAGDIVFAISGTKENLGTVSIIPKNISEANLNSALVRLILDEDRINKKYFCVVFGLDIVRRQINFIGKGAAQNNLNNEEISSIRIPIPNKTIQQKVINIYNTFVELKKQNKVKAEKLLASIDDYLLNELGITLPGPLENTLKNRMFKSSLKSISGNRFDSFFHQKIFHDNIQAIINGKYPVKQLWEIVKGNLIKGTLPNHDEKEGQNSVIQINCINADGMIDLNDVLTAKDIFSKEQKLNNGDILVVITGATIGKISYWNYKGDYFLGGDIVKFQTNSLTDNSFVYHYLRSTPIQTEIKRNITGATNGHLAPEDVKRLLIPFPPLPKQKEIAEHITNIRKQAQMLKDKTKLASKKANKQIEEILIGKD